MDFGAQKGYVSLFVLNLILFVYLFRDRACSVAQAKSPCYPLVMASQGLGLCMSSCLAQSKIILEIHLSLFPTVTEEITAH